MVIPNIEQITERVRQNQLQRAVDIAAAFSASPAADVSNVGGFRPGDRVFDRVTGEEGEVLYGTRENVIVPTTGS